MRGKGRGFSWSSRKEAGPTVSGNQCKEFGFYTVWSREIFENGGLVPDSDIISCILSNDHPGCCRGQRTKE